LSFGPLEATRRVLREMRNPAVAAVAVFEALFVALLVVPENPVAAVTGGAYTPLIAAFLSAVKLDLVPRGWELIGLTAGNALKINLAAAALVALVIDYPLIAFAIIGRVVPIGAENRESLVRKLVVAATLLFGAGLAFGYFFLARFFIIAQAPFFEAASVNPVINATGFYFGAFRATLIVGAVILVSTYALISWGRGRSIRSFRA